MANMYNVHASNPFRASVLLLSMMIILRIGNFLHFSSGYSTKKNEKEPFTNWGKFAQNTNINVFVVCAMISRNLLIISCRQTSSNAVFVVAIDFSLEKVWLWYETKVVQ